MDPRIIKSEREYGATVAELERLMESKPEEELSEEEAARIELLALLVQKWEDERIGPPAASPADVLRFVMEQRGLEQKDLADAFGDPARVSDFFAARRGLSLATIVALHRELHIPYEALIDESARRKPRGSKKRKRRSSSDHGVVAERPARYRSSRKK